jgi:hypothetical protein
MIFLDLVLENINDQKSNFLHLFIDGHVVTIFVPAAPWKRYQPLTVSSHLGFTVT